MTVMGRLGSILAVTIPKHIIELRRTALYLLSGKILQPFLANITFRLYSSSEPGAYDPHARALVVYCNSSNHRKG